MGLCPRCRPSSDTETFRKGASTNKSNESTLSGSNWEECDQCGNAYIE